MAALVHVNVKLRWDPQYKAEQVYPVAVRALRNIGEAWHRGTMPGHFQPSAMLKYGYKPRNEKYMRRRAPAGGPRRPLVWTGKLEARAKAAKTITISGRTKVRMKLTIWGGLPARRRELFSTTPGEQASMMLHLRRHLIDFLGPVQSPARYFASLQGGNV